MKNEEFHESNYLKSVLGFTCAFSIFAMSMTEPPEEPITLSVSNDETEIVIQEEGDPEEVVFELAVIEPSENIEVSTETPNIIRNSRVQIGANYTYVNMRPQGVSSFSGSLGGLQASYEYKPSNQIYGGVQLTWKEGSMARSPTNRSLLYIDVQEKLGYTAGFMEDQLLFTFFTGLGYRHFGQNLRLNGTNVLDFKYNEFYIPVGGIVDYTINSLLDLGLSITWMPQVYPTVAIVPLKGARWSLTKTLPNVYVEMPISFYPTKDRRFSVILAPTYEHWEDGHTTAENEQGVSLGLPKNIYNFWGGNINFMYRF